MMHYVGIIDGWGKTWGVRIPDLPGCHGAGSTAEAAIANAISAAREWEAHRTANGAALPVSRLLDEIINEDDDDLRQIDVVVMLPLSISQPPTD